MKRLTSARIAGAAYLLYIALALPSELLLNRATNVERTAGLAAKLARVAEHAPDVRIAIVLALVSCFAALVLAVTLYGITREEDHELALLGLSCRVAEGIVGSVGVLTTAGALAVATSLAGGRASDVGSWTAIGGMLLEVPRWSVPVSATFFAVGSTVFCYLLLRGRMVPIALAWLGVFASVLLVVLLPLRLSGYVDDPRMMLMWAPMGVFEVVLAVWFLAKGVRAPAPG